jgi:16S rRNA pseudouridine516 synthase
MRRHSNATIDQCAVKTVFQVKNNPSHLPVRFAYNVGFTFEPKYLFMRLDKYLSKATGLSRKEIKRAIMQRNVTVNGECIRDAGHHVDESDNIEFFDSEIDAPRPRYLMMHKPEGTVCSNDDKTHPTVMGLLFDEARPDDLHTVGRLDADTTGLLLITDDGQWSHRVTAPKHKMSKRYFVVTERPLDPSLVDIFQEGVQLHGEKQPTKPAVLDILSDHEAHLTLTEGKYHQVKRMFAAVDNHVLELHRDKIGDVELDESLEPGDYRELTEEECRLLGVELDD